jgi:hypothetical protein
MSAGIKSGDLVMVVKPRACCGNSDAIGMIFTVIGPAINPTTFCDSCYNTIPSDTHLYLSGGTACPPSRLKKIDPPATGDSLPTRADLRVPA